MGTTENFCLRWNDFESNLSSAFRELRDDADFFDVTLATDEDEVKAHKVVLSACSPHLKQVKYPYFGLIVNFVFIKYFIPSHFVINGVFLRQFFQESGFDIIYST